MRRSLLPLASAALCCLALHAAAQTPPDAGALQQQIERQRPQALPPASPAEHATPAPAPAGTGVTVTVREFRFAGNTLVDSAHLAPAVAPYLGHPLGLNELRDAATAVANAYRDAGWVVRAYLPRQDIRDGVVTIQIVEARLGRIEAEGEPARIERARVLSYFQRQAPGQPIGAPALDRALLLADDLPGVRVAGSLQPGANDGEADLALRLSDEPLFTGQVGADNAGARSTGAARLTAQLAASSPLRLGDQLAATLLHSRGSDYLRAGWSLPVGGDGWRVGVSAAHLNYHLVAPEFAALDGRGHSTALGLEASYPLVRSRQGNLYFSAALDRKGFGNGTTAGTTSRYHITSAGLGLSGNAFDPFGGGGASSASLLLTPGRVHLGAPDIGENPALEGGFHKLRYALARQQALSGSVSLYASLAGQWTRHRLDSAEKFYLGGPWGVRAYPVNEGAGDSGQLVNLELRWSLPQGLLLTGFYDWGRVTQNADGSAPSSGPNRYHLKGAGLSLAWQGPHGISVSATWARRQGGNPNPTATGLDQDGSRHRNRWWLSASLRF